MPRSQAFTQSGIDATVLTLWDLDDETATAVAERIHRLYAGGMPAAEALRTAQLEHRDEPAGRWGALALCR